MDGEKTTLKRLGKALHLSRSGRLVLRSQVKVRLGSVIYSRDLKNVGKVFDVFGPVKKPYISVRPNVRDPNNYVDQLLYVEE